jgi:predicted  nucleic acid-binding Zn-ribbon protein
MLCAGCQLAEDRAGAATREAAAAEERNTLEFTLQEANIAKSEVEEQLAAANEKVATLKKELEAANTYQQEIEGKVQNCRAGHISPRCSLHAPKLVESCRGTHCSRMRVPSYSVL